MHRALLVFALIAPCAARPFGYLRKEDVQTEILVRAMHRPENAVGNGGYTGTEWFQRNLEPSVRCALDARIGAVGDGGKWVCDPDQLIVKGNCTIMSVGSSNEYSFEAALEPYGCAVHTFDPTVAPDSRKPAHVQYHSLGLGTTAETRLSELIKVTSSQNIDILKVDCEGCEWGVLLDDTTLSALRAHVTQFLVEFHWKDAATMEAVGNRLLDAGFRVFSKEPNIQFSDGSCIEYSFLNIHRAHAHVLL